MTQDLVNRNLYAEPVTSLPASGQPGQLVQLVGSGGYYGWSPVSNGWQQIAGGIGGQTVIQGDDFSSDQLANYTAVEGTTKTGLTVSNGRLQHTNSVDHQFINNAAAINDAAVMIVKIVPNGSSTTVAQLSKWVSAGNEIYCQHLASAANVTLVLNVAGSNTIRQTISTPANATTQNWWIVLRISGPYVVIETHNVDPRLEASPVTQSTAPYLMTSAELAALGPGVSGRPKLRLTGWNGSAIAASTAELDDWVVTNPSLNSSGQRFQDEGVTLPLRDSVNFTGTGVIASDDAANSRTNVTIPGGGNPRPLIFDDFASGLSAWTTVLATPLGTTGGQLYQPNNATDSQMLRTGASLTDAVAAIQVIPGPSLNFNGGVFVRSSPTNANCLMGGFNDDGSNTVIRIQKQLAGGGLILISSSGFAPRAASGRVYWVVVRALLDLIVMEWWDTTSTDPRVPGASPAARVTVTLTGSDSTALGKGVSGSVGVRFYSAADTRMDNFQAYESVNNIYV